MNIDANEFARKFSLTGMTGDSENPAYRAYRVIQDHMDCISQLQSFGDDAGALAQLAEARRSLDENETADLVASVGAEKAAEILQHYGMKLHTGS